MGIFWQDLKFAGRTLKRSPGFLAVVIISIAIGIAANTTIFTLANAVLFGQLSVHEPDRLVNFANSEKGSSYSYPNYLDLRDGLRGAFEDIAAHFVVAPVSLNSERVWGQLVSGNYFKVIGVPMAAGRGIEPQEDAVQGRDRVVVLSHALWKRQFAGDPGIVGRTIMMNDRAWTVVGVAAAGFHGTDRMLMGEFWAPLAMYAELLPEIAREGPAMTQRNAQWIILDGRMKPGVSRKEALAATNVVNARLDAEYRKNQRPSKMMLETSGTLPGDMNSGASGMLAGLMVVVGLVLVIACANVANLLLARGAARQREMAVRLAVGGSRMRLIRQLLTESVLLSLGGAAAGFLLSYWATVAISHVELPIPIPISTHFAPDLRVLLFTITLSLVSAVLFGLAPALRATRPDLIKAMKSGGSSAGGSRRFGLRNVLVVTQVTLSMVLLISAGLFLRSLGKAGSIALGMKPGPVLSIAFDPNNLKSIEIGPFLDEVKRRVAALPGIASVSYTDFIPLSVVGHESRFTSGDLPPVESSVVMADRGYFETMGIPLVSGRDFGHEAGRLVTVINRAMADRLFAGKNPLGGTIRDPEKPDVYEVIGVVGNSKQRTLGEGEIPAVYVPLDQNLGKIMSLTGVALVARASSPATMLEAVRREIHAVDPNLAVFNALTMKDQAEKAMWIPRLTAALFTIFGLSGLALAVVGLYGVMSFSVGRRTKEIGIRMALGAERGRILGMVTRQGLGLTAVGLGIGVALALAASRFAVSLLYGVSPRDVVTFVGVPLILGMSGLAASVIPARRAAKLDPMVALRYE